MDPLNNLHSQCRGTLRGQIRNLADWMTLSLFTYYKGLRLNTYFWTAKYKIKHVKSIFCLTHLGNSQREAEPEDSLCMMHKQRGMQNFHPILLPAFSSSPLSAICVLATDQILGEVTFSSPGKESTT